MPLLRSRSLRRRAAAQASPASRRSALVALAVALLVPTAPTSALAANGDLDPTFGSGGKTTTDFFDQTDEAEAIALQSDGKIVAVGNTHRSGSSNSTFAVARYNTDGSLDPTFGDGGRVVTDFSRFGDEATSVAVQPDGKIVVAGSSSPNGSTSDFALARYLTNGSLDPDFGDGGKTTFAVGRNSAGRAVVVLPDGKLLVAGSTVVSTGDFALARFDADGSVDTSFGTNGKATIDFGGGGETLTSLARQDDGKIVVVGYTQDSTRAFLGAVARFLADGTLDTSFGSNGKIVEKVASHDGYYTAVAAQADGKIVAAGIGGPSDNEFVVARYLPSGKIDTTFGGDGIVATNLGGDAAYASALVIRPDGRVLAVGTSLRISGSDFDGTAAAVTQYLPDGRLDPSFGDAGKITVDYSSEESQAYAAVLQPDGYLVIAGYADGPSGSDDFALARVDVRPETDYSISVDSPTLTVSRKDRGDITVNVARVGGFDGNVVVTAPDTSALKVKIAPAQASTTGGSVSFSYKVKKKAPLGSYPLEFKAVDDMGRARVVTLTLVIQ